MKIFQKILITAFGFFILFGLLAFSTYKSKTAEQDKIQISIWGTIDSVSFDYFINKFVNDTGRKINVKYTQKNIDTIDGEIVEAVATGKTPDVVLFPQEFIKRYLDKVYFIDYKNISERTFKDTYVGEAELFLNSKGIFALPLFVDPLVMYWNKDMFSSAGISSPPEKWSEFPLLANKISESDINSNIKKSFVSFGEYRNVDNAKAILSNLIIQAGSPIVSYKDSAFTTSLLSSFDNVNSSVVSAINFFLEYSNPKKSVYSWNRSLLPSRQSFLAENLATYFGFASEVEEISDKNPNLNFDVSIVPQVVDSKYKSTFGKIYGFTIMKNSKNIVTAYNIISLLTSSEAAPFFLEYFNVAPARKDIINLGVKDPIKDVFYKSALISKGWVDPDTKITDNIFQSMIEDVTTGKNNVNDSITKVDTKLKELLK
jgi:ABC-type glycerol-3-phosphate transport system substrate-binding protein